MSVYEDYEKYPDGSIKDPEAAVRDGNQEYWPDGTEKS